MAATLREGGFVSCRGDPDVWMRPKVKTNGDKYWEYVLCYVDDILCVSHEPQVVMDYLASKYTLKKGSVKEPDSYLGAEVKKWTIDGADNPSKNSTKPESTLKKKHNAIAYHRVREAQAAGIVRIAKEDGEPTWRISQPSVFLGHG
ncbi:hypothetical protein MHU86_13534 [Fragilaria crotonensis]|nr:hypothetical protein MHU86_13534 [Fragilaria crotonensis]